MISNPITTSRAKTLPCSGTLRKCEKPFYIGKIRDSKAPDLMLNMSFLNEHFSRLKDGHFPHWLARKISRMNLTRFPLRVKAIFFENFYLCMGCVSDVVQPA